MNMTTQKTLYLANPYGFSAQQRQGPLQELVAALESKGAQVWEPFARNNQIDQTSPNWAYRIGIAKAFWCRLPLKEVHLSSGLFVFIGVHSWFIFINDRPFFLE